MKSLVDAGLDAGFTDFDEARENQNFSYPHNGLASLLIAFDFTNFVWMVRTSRSYYIHSKYIHSIEMVITKSKLASLK